MLKTLWVMRHGLAESEFDSDFNRALSDTGFEQATKVARSIKVDGDLPTRLLVSPFRRTQETANAVMQVLDLSCEKETEEMLVHFGDHKLLGDYLLSLEDEKVMIISHMPIVARLCLYLEPNCGIFSFETAQVVKLSIEDNKVSVSKVYKSTS